MVLENRQSHHRLIIAMAMSSVVILPLLEILSMLISNAVCSDARCFEKLDILTVYIVQPKSEPVSEITLPDHEIRPFPPVQQETANPQTAGTVGNEHDAERDEELYPPSDLTPVRDWYALAKESARQSIDDRFDQEEIRKLMWRKTGSVMFKDTGEFDVHEPETVMAESKFRVPLGVLGIGITIGGCFFGIPLAGIPVERRTAGPTVIYCGDVYE